MNTESELMDEYIANARAVLKTDRELLELAAKAAGKSGLYRDDTVSRKGFYLYPNEQFWSPLTDDGDALRLAVATGVMQGRGFDNAWNAMFAVGKLPKDKFEATRRAIVRAAAAIGEAL